MRVCERSLNNVACDIVIDRVTVELHEINCQETRARNDDQDKAAYITVRVSIVITDHSITIGIGNKTSQIRTSASGW